MQIHHYILGLIFILVGSVVLLHNLLQVQPSSNFESWKQTFGIQYQTYYQNLFREIIFEQNLAKIIAHNNNLQRTYSQGINQFTAMTHQQFVRTYLGLVEQYKAESLLTHTEQKDYSNQDSSVSGLKFDVDWRARGAVTPVKNQGKCGSCWAFSTTGGLEGFHKLAYGTLLSYSQQQLVDCSSSYGNNGCNGGQMNHAYSYVKDRGILTEQEYPYIGVQQKCVKDGGSFKISGHTTIYSCTDLQLKVTRQPISVGVDATNWSSYKDGVFSNCGTYINHGVTLVGIKDGDWVVKNSWGATWGEQGYITLKGSNSTCGICQTATYPNK